MSESRGEGTREELRLGGRAAEGQRLIWLDRAVVDRLGAMRGPGESYSDVILRIARETQVGDRL